MQKRITCLVLCVVFFLTAWTQQVFALETSAAAEEQITEMSDAEPVDSSLAPAESEGPCILLDGSVIENAAPILYEQTTYVSLYAVTMALRPDATITWEGDHAAVTAEGLSMTAYPGAKYIEVNDRCLYLPHTVLLIDGSTKLPVRVLAKALDAQVEWDAETGNTHLTSGTGAIVSGDEFYDEDSLYWLSHIIYAESGNQPLTGKIGVGNVVLNRVGNPIFPNSIHDVIFQRNQFTPVKNGSIYAEPNEESVLAAKLCLEGAVVFSDALWFNRAGLNCWASRHKSFVATIGSHTFYA